MYIKTLRKLLATNICTRLCSSNIYSDVVSILALYKVVKYESLFSKFWVNRKRGKRKKE